MTWAFRTPIENVGAKFLLVALAEHARDDGQEGWTCFPSIKRLSRWTAQGERTIERHLSWLTAEGWSAAKFDMTAGGVRVGSLSLPRRRSGQQGLELWTGLRRAVERLHESVKVFGRELKQALVNEHIFRPPLDRVVVMPGNHGSNPIHRCQGTSMSESVSEFYPPNARA